MRCRPSRLGNDHSGNVTAPAAARSAFGVQLLDSIPDDRVTYLAEMIAENLVHVVHNDETLIRPQQGQDVCLDFRQSLVGQLLQSRYGGFTKQSPRVIMGTRLSVTPSLPGKRSR